MPVPDVRDCGRGAAVEPLEQMRQVCRRDPGTVIAHLNDEPFSPDASGHVRSTDPAGG